MTHGRLGRMQTRWPRGAQYSSHDKKPPRRPDVYKRQEQRSAAAQAMALRDEDYHFGLVYDGGAFAGLLLYWEAPAQKGGPACRAAQGFLYVEHFCICLLYTSRCV